jgi:hypothetical protein
VQKHLTRMIREVQGEKCLKVLMGLLVLANVGLLVLLVVPAPA